MKEKKLLQKHLYLNRLFVVVVVKFMTSFKHIRCCMFLYRAEPIHI